MLMPNDMPIVTNIQRFCVHDGPGIRTTVFLKGCPLHCPWCANPENLNFGLVDGFGYEVPPMDLVEACIKDAPYYIDGGGVTFSGGEPLSQIELYESALAELKSKGIHLCVETSLCCSMNTLKTALQYFNQFIVDIKIITATEAHEVIGLTLSVFLNNMETLITADANVVWRIPLVRGYTDTDGNIAEIKSLAQKYSGRVLACELLPAHNIAENKYKLAGMTFERCAPSEEGVFSQLEDTMSICRIPCARLSI